MKKIKKSTPSFPVAAIGSSAGGMEAAQQFLRHLPVDTGMAFVFISHLDPKHESELAKILSAVTALPVERVTPHLKIQPNRAYVIPPGHLLSLRQNHFHLKPAPPIGVPVAIDYFFQSLAEARENQAVGILLSGTGTDGTLGLEAIKARGGFTFAQDEASARFPEMPAHAVASGAVDLVLTPERMSEEITKFSRDPYLARLGGVSPADEHDELKHIFRLLHKITQVDFSAYKLNTIQRRLRRRMTLHKIDTIRSYHKFLEENPMELQALQQDLLIKVTGFFRDPEVFDFLAKKVFPRIVAHASRSAPIRIWAPACSTGEEPYSLAMALLEFLGDHGNSVPFQIFATDISEWAVERARAGLYPENIALHVSPQRLRRFFVKVNGGYRAAKGIRDVCIFARQDVTNDPPFSKIDLISCRNLMIYLEPVLQKKMMHTFHYALRPHGFLMLGTSETVGTFQHLYTVVDKRFKIYVKADTLKHARFEFPHNSFSNLEKEEALSVARPRKDSWNELDMQRQVDRLIISRYAPAGVIVNENLEIIHFRGNTAPYIQPGSGKASLNLLKMVHESLVFELRSVLHKALEKDGKVRRENIAMGAPGQAKRITIEVIPMKFAASETRYFLILFEEVRPSLKSAGIPPAAQAPKKKARAGDVERLTQELFETKDQLQSIIEEQEATNEELQSANEEVMSANEELQSTNEELETAKEELQSTNEELTTVNEELQNRNQELSQVNSDLTNLLSGVNIPIIVLTNDLRIRRYTPTVEKLFKVISTDVGRRLSDIKTRMNIPDLDERVKKVIDHISLDEVLTQDDSGHWYHVRIRPYKTRENKIDGAVVTFLQLEELKRTYEEIDRLKDKKLNAIKE